MTLRPKAIHALILDMDGVLWRDAQPIGDLPAIFAELQRRGCPVVLATNNATRSVEQYLEKLAGFGVHLEPWQIVTSGQAVAHYLHELFPEGGPLYVVGEAALERALADRNFYFSDERPLAVVGSMDRQLTFQKLSAATQWIRQGLPFVGTNPDRTFPTPAGLIPGTGSILAALEAASGVKPVIAGKPSPRMYQVAMERLKTPPEETLVVGDRPETDIAGAQALGCPCGLVLSGVTSPADQHTWQPAPDFIAPDLAALLQMLKLV